MSRTKRLLDLSMAAIGLTVLAPTMALVALGLRHSTGNTAIFRQVRAGLHGRPFVLLKYRTMTEGRDAAAGLLLSDSERLTRFGRVVRSLSIDEFPQLWNVLRGEMSAVGPRPLPVEYIDLYSEREQIRLRVLPGITGWAQINGRQTIPFGRRLELDAWYVDHWTVALDLRILLVTVPRLLRRTGVVLGQDVQEVDDRGFGKFWRGTRPGDVHLRPVRMPPRTVARPQENR